MNAREQLIAIADWLGWQEESLSFGLRNSMDALRLYDYAQAHPNLPEMADDWMPCSLIAALGYNPFEQKEAIKGRDVTTTGATDAAKALKAARALIDSVAYVAKEGDKHKVISSIDQVLLAGLSNPNYGQCIGKIWWNADNLAEAEQWKTEYLKKGAISVELKPEDDRGIVGVIITLDRNQAEEIFGHEVGDEEWLDMSVEEIGKC
jgi:hypothetical protein